MYNLNPNKSHLKMYSQFDGAEEKITHVSWRLTAMFKDMNYNLIEQFTFTYYVVKVLDLQLIIPSFHHYQRISHYFIHMYNVLRVCLMCT